MNKVILMGRLTKDVDVKTSQNANNVAKYTLAVDRRLSGEQRKNENVQTADFISIVAFGKSADFAEKYFRKGMKVVVTGRIQTGSYTNKDGVKVYTTDVVAEDQEFAESKASQDGAAASSNNAALSDSGDGFMDIPDGIDEELPFN